MDNGQNDISALVAKAWASLAAVPSGRGPLAPALAAYGEAIDGADRAVVAADRSYPGKGSTAEHKARWKRELDEARNARATARVILDPLLARARAYATGRGPAYDAACEARRDRETPRLARFARDVDARQARIGHALDAATIDAMRRSYLGQ